MHHPTRRTKRLQRPLSSTRPPLPDTRFDDIPSSPNHARHRQVAWKPDMVRGTIFLALVAVTIVLYMILWEWERYPSFQFQSVPNPDVKIRNVVISSLSSGGTSTEADPVSTLYLLADPQNRNDPSPSNAKGPNPTVDRITASPSTSNLDRPAMRDTSPPPLTRSLDESHETHHSGAAFSPPRVDDRVPEDDNTKLLLSFDSTYCNGACHFLLPVRIGEQESKARIHFMQLVILARRLGRTIVFPNVGQSRMNVCAKWPFGAYYDTNGLFERGSEDSGDSSPLAIDLDRFAKWVDERPTPPRGVVVSMHHQSVRQDLPDAWRTQLEPLEDGPFTAETTDTVDPKILSCLDSKLPRLCSALPEVALSFSFESKPSNATVSTRLVQLLSSISLYMDSESEFNWMAGPGYDYTPQYYTNASSLSLADIDVLLFDYDLRYPLFSASDSVQPDVGLHYSPVLYNLADRLADNLGPFVAIHWRMESVPVQNLAWCAASLVTILHTLLQSDSDGMGKYVKYVWLATDHPFPLSAFMDLDDRRPSPVHVNNTSQKKSEDRPRRPGVRKSSTFRALSSEHDDAIGILAEAFQPGGDLEAWTLTDLVEQLRLYPYVEGRLTDMDDEALLEDPGVLGILDKLVVVQASAFVSGSTACSKTSSFSKQVIEARQEVFEAERGEGAIRNVVEYFGEW